MDTKKLAVVSHFQLQWWEDPNLVWTINQLWMRLFLAQFIWWTAFGGGPFLDPNVLTWSGCCNQRGWEYLVRISMTAFFIYIYIHNDMYVLLLYQHLIQLVDTNSPKMGFGWRVFSIQLHIIETTHQHWRGRGQPSHLLGQPATVLLDNMGSYST